MRSINIVAYMSLSYGMLNIQYYLLGILSVLFGFSEPSQWPDEFGSWADAYTVRRFWG